MAMTSSSGGGWPFSRHDTFSTLDRRHHAGVIHSLPGVFIWPLMLWAMAIIAAWFAREVWQTVETRMSWGTAYMLSIAISYFGLGLLFLFWLLTIGLAGRVFSTLPRNGGDWGAAILALLAALVVGPEFSIWFYEFAMLPSPGPAPSPEELGNVDDIQQRGAAVWAVVLAVVIAAPIIEEAIFRGWMLPMMVARGVPWIFAIAITSAGFGLMHIFWGLQVVAYTTILGVFLGVARMMTGRIAAPVLAHVGNNAWAVYIAPWLYMNI
jgi:membrane protease YdiL (CAAX protease family)